MKYFYVDTQEKRAYPKEGPQWTAWYMGGTQNNPGGREFTDVIRGDECILRAMTEENMVSFLKMAYSRAPYIKPRHIVEKGDE
jgi:hypothetical protein